MRNLRPMLALAAWFGLLTAYVYYHANSETFVIYLLAMVLWVGLFGYCVRTREKQPEKASVPLYHSEKVLGGSPPFLCPLIAGVAVGALVGTVFLYQPSLNISLSGLASLVSPASAGSASGFAICNKGSGQNCVMDGDTFWYDGVGIRVADIAAPETHPPRCKREADLGRRAALRLKQLLNEGPFELERVGRDQDRFGRKLRIVIRDGQSLGSVLVSEGLARHSQGVRQTWC